MGLALTGSLAAQPATPRPHPDVPTAFDVAGLHLVLTEEAQRLVQQKADGLCRHQPSFQARVDLADASFPIIDRVLQEEGVPLDFRYLALQESALLGDAQSTHEAVGYWQLKRETATGLGLVVSDDVDERKHLTASTRAAARYLARNNAALHNWLDALLSYNTGLGGVKPYVLPTDADATEMSITEATSPYVLMFLAQKIAFESACGLNPRPPLRLQEFPAVAGQSIEAQAQFFHADPTALALHNRWLLAAAVPTDRPYTLIVPITNGALAAGAVASQGMLSRKKPLSAPTVNAAITAEVRVNNLRALIALPGETTADLARRGSQRLGEFLHHNELTAFDVAVPGRPYFLESKRDAAEVEYHVVQPGETVLDVAQKYGVRKRAIMAKNRLALADELRPGRLLWLQHVRPREVGVEYRTLPEGMALERSTPAPSIAGSAAAPARRPASSEAYKRRMAHKRRVVTEDRDGWGEALPVPSPGPEPVSAPPVVAAPAPMPRPAASAPEVAQLPPPAPAPVPEPLADEPSAPGPVTEIVISRPSVVTKDVPVPAPAPAKPVIVVAPRPVAAAPKPLPVPAPIAASETTHRVEPKETVYSISRRYQMAPATLIALNHLVPPASLIIGQVLVLKAQEPESVAAQPVLPPPRPVRPAPGTNPAIYIPKTAASQASAVPSVAAAGPAVQHTVATGETLYSISRRYQVTVADLQAWNEKLDGNVRVGEVLRVQASTK